MALDTLKALDTRKAPNGLKAPSRLRGVLVSVLALGCVGFLLPGCASKPKSASKKRTRTILMTEYDDMRVGREASSDVAAQIGVIDDPELQAYVSGIGRKLLRGIPMRFDYQFAVVDQVEPNAFALPGGYIFISRGLLALANSEDELACVLGHEITHAAHRHAAAQQQLGKRVSPVAMPWNRAARMAAYGRDMERDADKGGQILCAAAGYDPMGMSTFLDSLGQAERLEMGYSRRASFFATHPGSRERAAVNAVRAGEMRWRRDPALADSRATLMQQIDGLALGQRPEAGVFRGNDFLHPDLDFYVRFPAGWLQSNSNRAVGATSPRGEAVVFLEADTPAGDAETVAQQWIEKTSEEQTLHVAESKHVKVGHIDAWRLRVDTSGYGGQLSAYVTFIPYQELTWRISGMARASLANQFLGRTLATSRSFRPLTDAERRSVDVTRLHTMTAYPGESLEALGRRAGTAWGLADAAIYNGVFIDHRFEGGELVKFAAVERYVPKADEE